MEAAFCQAELRTGLGGQRFGAGLSDRDGFFRAPSARERRTVGERISELPDGLPMVLFNFQFCVFHHSFAFPLEGTSKTWKTLPYSRFKKNLVQDKRIKNFQMTIGRGLPGHPGFSVCRASKLPGRRQSQHIIH